MWACRGPRPSSMENLNQLFLNKKGDCPFCGKKPRRYTKNFVRCTGCGRYYSIITGQEVPNVSNYGADGELLKGVAV